MQTGVAHLSRAGDERSIGALLRAGLELRGLIRDWRASLDEMLRRFLGDDEAAKFAVAGNLAYYADDPQRMAWPFFAMAQGGFLKSGGVFVHGGSRTLSMKLAKVGDEGRRFGAARTRGGGRRPRRRGAPGVRAPRRPEEPRDGRARRRGPSVRQLRADDARFDAAGIGARRAAARLWRARAVDLALLRAFRSRRAARAASVSTVTDRWCCRRG